METEETVVVPETTEEVAVVTPTETPTEAVEEVAEESVEDLKARLAKAEEYGNNQKIRAEKAEKEKKTVVPPAQGTYTLADQIAITNAKVHEDDVERVEKFAKSEGVSIKEALKNPELKAILDLRNEQRDTASAANVTATRRGPTQVPDATLIANANAGKLPELDADIEKLIAAKARASRG